MFLAHLPGSSHRRHATHDSLTFDEDSRAFQIANTPTKGSLLAPDIGPPDHEVEVAESLAKTNLQMNKREWSRLKIISARCKSGSAIGTRDRPGKKLQWEVVDEE
jgi:hypothetical protein